MVLTLSSEHFSAAFFLVFFSPSTDTQSCSFCWRLDGWNCRNSLSLLVVMLTNDIRSLRHRGLISHSTRPLLSSRRRCFQMLSFLFHLIFIYTLKWDEEFFCEFYIAIVSRDENTQIENLFCFVGQFFSHIHRQYNFGGFSIWYEFFAQVEPRQPSVYQVDFPHSSADYMRVLFCHSFGYLLHYSFLIQFKRSVLEFAPKLAQRIKVSARLCWWNERKANAHGAVKETILQKWKKK